MCELKFFFFGFCFLIKTLSWVLLTFIPFQFFTFNIKIGQKGAQRMNCNIPITLLKKKIFPCHTLTDRQPHSHNPARFYAKPHKMMKKKNSKALDCTSHESEIYFNGWQIFSTYFMGKHMIDTCCTLERWKKEERTPFCVFSIERWIP